MEMIIRDISKSIILGLLAAISVLMCVKLELPAWVLFIGWSSYGIFCTTTRKGFVVLAEETLGMLIAYAINVLGSTLNNLVSNSGILLSVFFIVMLLYWVTKLKVLNNLITYFLGMTAWFSYDSDTLADLPMLALCLFLGLCFGYTYAFLDKIVTKI